MGGRGRMKEKEDDRRKERNGRLVWQVFYLFRKYRCYDTGWGWSRGKNDNGRKWRAHRSFNPSSAARLLEYIYKLGLEENFQLLTFDFNATIPIYIYIYIDIDDSYNLLSKEKKRLERWGFRQSMSWVNVQRVQVGASTGEKKRGQSIPTGWSLFFRPRCRLKKKETEISLYLSFSFSRQAWNREWRETWPCLVN